MTIAAILQPAAGYHWAVAPRITIHPLTSERWPDLETVFGPQGAYGGCWCIWFRRRRKESERAKNAQNKAGLKAIVDSGEPPGLLAYVAGEPAAWVSLDPREKYPLLVHSRKNPPIDDQPVWSIVCFVVARAYRRQGLMSELLRGAVDYAQDRGAGIVEAYPVEPHGDLAGDTGFSGVASVFFAAGFREVGRSKTGRLIVRLNLQS